MRILLIEDDLDYCRSLKRTLVEAGHVVETAHDGDEGLLYARTEDYDLIILDVMLPGINGIVVCRKLREFGNSVPILMLTAKTLVSDRVAGLDAGADDYLCKPFSSTELKAKLRVYQRRAAGENSPLINAGGVTMDTVSRTVTINDQSVKFTPTEYRLLEYLITHPNRLITRTMIKEHVWGGENDRESNIINVYMERLRSKLGCRPGGGLIETVRGEGYRLNRL